jgi:hypothetical protein
LAQSGPISFLCGRILIKLCAIHFMSRLERRIHAIVELADAGGHLQYVLRILALMTSLFLLGCGTSENKAVPANKTGAPARQPQSEQHRAACLPQAGGGIICQ